MDDQRAEMKIREYLVAYRKELGLPQVEVARRMGITQSGVSDLETGEMQNLTMGTLRAWAQALELGCSVQFTEPTRRTFPLSDPT